jgi:hypothetical protein
LDKDDFVAAVIELFFEANSYREYNFDRGKLKRTSKAHKAHYLAEAAFQIAGKTNANSDTLADRRAIDERRLS